MFLGQKLLFQVHTNLPGSDQIVSNIYSCLEENNLTNLTIAMESTSFYSWHLANILATREALICFKPKVHCMNLRVIAHIRNLLLIWIKPPHRMYLSSQTFQELVKYYCSLEW